MAPRKVALALFIVACLGLAGCAGDGDVVLPSDTKPKPSGTTTQNLTCAEILATTTTRRVADGSYVVPLVTCSER